MQNESEIVKNAILKTLEYLKLHEPKCICEQCKFGYRYDKNSEIECKEHMQEIKKDHEKWEQKLFLWENKLKNAE